MENKTETKPINEKAQWIKNNFDPTKHVSYVQSIFNKRMETKLDTIEQLLKALITK